MRGGIEGLRGAIESETDNGDIGYARGRRPPCLAVVGGEEDAEVSADVQRARTGVQENRVDRHVEQVRTNVLPRGAAVDGLEDMPRAKAGNRDVGVLVVRRVDLDAGNPTVGKPGGDVCPGRAAVRRYLHRSIARSDINRLRTAGGHRDGRDRSGQLHDRSPRLSVVARAVQRVGAEVEHLWIHRIHDEGADEEHGVAKIYADRLRHKGPTRAPIASIWPIGPLEFREHRGRGLGTHRRKPTVTAQDLWPGWRSVVLEGSVVLRAPQQLVTGPGEGGDSRGELGDRKGGIQVGPGGPVIRRLVDATIITRVEDGRILLVDDQRMLIYVDRVADVREVGAAIRRSIHGEAAEIHQIGVCGIDGDDEIVPALA